MRRIEIMWKPGAFYRMWLCDCGQFVQCNPWAPELAKETKAHCLYCKKEQTKKFMKEHYYDAN